MLRATVTLNRTIRRDSEDYGYGVTLDGEVTHPTEDAEAVLDRVAELFHLAEEALTVQIERDPGSSPTADRQPSRPSPPSDSVNRNPRVAPQPSPQKDHGLGENGSSSQEPATPKQVRYLQTLGKRQGLSARDLETTVTHVVGTPKPLSELTKREAGAVINHLTNTRSEVTR